MSKDIEDKRPDVKTSKVKTNILPSSPVRLDETSPTQQPKGPPILSIVRQSPKSSTNLDQNMFA